MSGIFNRFIFLTKVTLLIIMVCVHCTSVFKLKMTCIDAKVTENTSSGFWCMLSNQTP